jgi:P27 family predicted phage terminase small subunit
MPQPDPGFVGPRERATYERLAALVAPARPKAIDGVALSLMAALHVQLHDAINDVRMNGQSVTVETKGGLTRKRSDAMITVENLSRILMTLGAKFGMTPADRAGLELGEEEEERQTGASSDKARNLVLLQFGEKKDTDDSEGTREGTDGASGV